MVLSTVFVRQYMRLTGRDACAGLNIPSRTSSGALVRLTALRHMLGQRATSSRSAAELAHLLSYGAHCSSLHMPGGQTLMSWKYLQA